LVIDYTEPFVFLMSAYTQTALMRRIPKFKNRFARQPYGTVEALNMVYKKIKIGKNLMR